MIEEMRQWVDERCPDGDTENDNADVRGQVLRLLNAVTAYSEHVTGEGYNSKTSFEDFIRIYYEGGE